MLQALFGGIMVFSGHLHSCLVEKDMLGMQIFFRVVPYVLLIRENLN